MRTALSISIRDRIARLIATNQQFKDETRFCFDSAAFGTPPGIARWKASAMAITAFVRLEGPLQQYGLHADPPRPEQLDDLFLTCVGDGNSSLSYPEFEMFMAGVIEIAAVAAARDFSRRYGVGMVAGTAGLAILKRIVGRIPGGGCAQRVLAFLPVVLAGPLLGAAVVYDMEVGHWLAAPRRLVGKPPIPPAPASRSLPL